MNSVTRVWAGLGVVLLVTCAVAQQPSAASPAPVQVQPASAPVVSDEPGPRIELSPTSFDFGDVWQGTPASSDFKIKNTGVAPLTLSVTSSCGCTVATKPKSPLEPGETGTFTITYDTKRLGDADKKVTITTNDPTQPSVVVNVKGRVKPIFALSPTEAVSFEDAEANTVASKTIRLENKYGQPLPLRIKEGQNIEQYQLELKEIEPGMVFELTVTTRPPLAPGRNLTALALETGLAQMPDLSVTLAANVQPRAAVMPLALYITPDAKQPKPQLISVQYRADKPLKITGVRSTLESIEVELLPQGVVQEGVRVAYHKIRVNLPAFENLPEEGAKIIITTDDPDPKFATMEVPVTRRQGIRRPPASSAPARTTTTVGPTSPVSEPTTSPAADPGK